MVISTKTYATKSLTLSRKPGKDRDGLWTAFIGLFEEKNPHLKGKVPTEVVEFREVEKVRIHDLRNISYYLMGSDLIINNLEEVTIGKESSVVTITGRQSLPK